MREWMTKSEKWMDYHLTSTVRAVTKWYFDLIKNAAIVSGLLYASKKTGDPAIKVVAGLSIGMFLLYTFSYPWEAFTALGNYGRSHSPLLALFIALLAGIVLLVLVVIISLAVMGVLAALFNAQGSIK